jgi:hypothetical protein
MTPASKLTVPLAAPPTALTLSVCPPSLAGPLLSLPSRSAAGKVSAVSSADAFTSSPASGASFTSVTLTFTVPVASFGSATLAVVPLSPTV